MRTHTMKAYGGLEEQLRALLTSTVNGGNLLCIPATLQIGKQPPKDPLKRWLGGPQSWSREQRYFIPCPFGMPSQWPSCYTNDSILAPKVKHPMA